MEEHLNPLAVTHLLQHTLRSLCIHDNSQWVYAVFWRILPRNYPPPKWDGQGACDRSRGNRRNWILVWEDGFCNFGASATEMNTVGDCPPPVYANCELQQYQGLQPELFFKMSHEIYNYGEGLIGKVAADHSHKWIHKEPNEQEINFLSAWHNSSDSYPRTWEAQFQSGIQSIALIAVREGVIQLGAVNKVIEDLSYVVMLRKKFSYIENIPGVLLPHPSSSAHPYINNSASDTWQQYYPTSAAAPQPQPQSQSDHHQFLHDHFITPSMSSLEALLSKLPSVVPPQQQQDQHGCTFYHNNNDQFNSNNDGGFVTSQFMVAAKEEINGGCGDDEGDGGDRGLVGESSNSGLGYNNRREYNRHEVNVSSSGRPNINRFFNDNNY